MVNSKTIFYLLQDGYRQKSLGQTRVASARTCANSQGTRRNRAKAMCWYGIASLRFEAAYHLEC